MFRHDPAHTGAVGNLPAVPTQTWKYQTDGGVFSSPAVVNGVVYIGSGDDNVYALNAATGAKIWNYTIDTNGLGIRDSSPAVSEGVVYICTSQIYALNASTGSKIWSYEAESDCSPAVVDGAVYVISDGGEVYALNAATGIKIWNYTTEGTGSRFSPAVANGVVYAAMAGTNLRGGPETPSKLYALNVTSGFNLWNYTLLGDTKMLSSPVVENGVVYITHGHVYALDASNGSMLWISSQSVYSGESSPAVSDGVLYVGASGHPNFFAFNTTDGTQLWSYYVNGSEVISSSPAVHRGIVYFGAYNNKTYALNATSGLLLWNYTTGGDVDSSPAVVDGVVYIGSWDGNVYAIVEATTSPIPVFLPWILVAVGAVIALLVVIIRKGKKKKRLT